MLKGLLIKNIGCLVGTGDHPGNKISGKKMAELETIRDAFLYISDGIIIEFRTGRRVKGK